jgi:hypothetical protein
MPATWVPWPPAMFIPWSPWQSSGSSSGMGALPDWEAS